MNFHAGDFVTFPIRDWQEKDRKGTERVRGKIVLGVEKVISP